MTNRPAQYSSPLAIHPLTASDCNSFSGSSNRGVKTEKTEESNVSTRFDWYQVTVSKDVTLERLYSLFLCIFEGVYPSSAAMTPEVSKFCGRNYRYCERLDMESGSVLFYHGGSTHEEYGINICAWGSLSNQIAEILKNQEFEQRLSRADVCQDFRGSYDEVRGVLADQGGRLKITESGTPLVAGGIEARTIRCGSRESTYSVVCYEKGLQLGAPYPSDFLRIEHQFRPKSRQKGACAKLTAEELLGTNKRAIKMAEKILGMELEKYQMDIRKPLKSTFSSMVYQYHRTLRDFFDVYGPCGGGELIVSEISRFKDQKYLIQ